MGRCTGNQRGVLGNVGICRSATATDNIHQALMDILFYFMRHIGRSLVVCTQTVGQSGIGISADVIRCTGSKLLQERFQLTGAKGAVQADREYIGMLHRSEKGFQSLPRQRTPSNIGNGHREHQGYMNSYSFHRLPYGKNSSLGIQRIKNSFYQQSIHTPFEQRFHLLTVGIGKFIVAQGTKGRIVHIGTHGAGLVRRSYGACHKTGFVGSKRSKLICHFACQAHCGKIHLTHIVLHMIIGHTDAGGTECICFDNIRTCRQILAVNVLYHIGACQTKQVIVTFHLSGNLREAFTPKISLCQVVLLYHGAHCTIQNKDALTHQTTKFTHIIF